MTSRTLRRAARMALAALITLASFTSTGLVTRAARAETPSVAGAALPAIEKTRLGNGLEVILHVDHRTPIVSVNVWYHVGSKDEPAGKNGFAHLFEHIMFQGSKHVPEDAYFLYLERVGATDVNGTTNPDRTNYYETVPKNRLSLPLWLESDRMGFLLSHVDELTFAGQRDVVKNERRQNYENAPYGLVGQFIHERLYPQGHPYRLLTIGTPQDLDAASLEDVKSFFRTWYSPNNATLVISGDIDTKKTLELVEKYFGPIPSGSIPARSVPAPVVLDKEARLDVVAGVELPRVYLTWPTPAMFSPGDGELDLVAHILSSGKTSRLYKKLVYDLQIAQDVSAYQSSGQLGSTFEIVATAQPGHTAQEMLKAIDEELDTLRSGGVKDAELARAKTSVLSALTFQLEKNANRADQINAYNQYTGDPNYLPKDIARYEGATGNALREAARRHLPPDKRIVTLVTPEKGAPVAGRLRGGAR
ncbi:M16 family metallopeptidase [Pendulispora albinea]|uniref:Insulinase family protein n=1 Tax=Pendulispora albinea TaxID=2741071 RepID=A0ABZ2M9V4_9BACT